MVYTLELLLSTIVLRPYVFVFLAIYLVAAGSQIGLKKGGLFALWAYLVAFLCEYSSTRNGFPFGYYTYLEATRGKELWISNVPLMDSLSFVFLSYISYSLSLFFTSPLYVSSQDVFLVDTKQIRYSYRTLFLAILLFVWLDIVIDPVALKGDRWFLGSIYAYPEEGIYFGVPLANFLGWAVVGFLILWPFQRAELRWGERDGLRPSTRLYFPFSTLLGPLLYYGVVGFNLFMTFWIGEPFQGLVGCLIHGPIAFLWILQFLKESNRVSRSDLERHLQDFPSSPARSLTQRDSSGSG
ncbi:MAG: carotenoid biosynthesis protein [Candidatus Tectomicrobia bacterium]|uniref:Carotenoid biosynthesis protein n=1 Tax=Tectimicrobiota bacterium TaxID=2528274 RepID=A0A932CMU2_UNCTE|nr:carotenoid biosynthesis protein [Candidatus Tectomicrobia bacterium]